MTDGESMYELCSFHSRNFCCTQPYDIKRGMHPATFFIILSQRRLSFKILCISRVRKDDFFESRYNFIPAASSNSSSPYLSDSSEVKYFFSRIFHSNIQVFFKYSVRKNTTSDAGQNKGACVAF